MTARHTGKHHCWPNRIYTKDAVPYSHINIYIYTYNSCSYGRSGYRNVHGVTGSHGRGNSGCGQRQYRRYRRRGPSAAGRGGRGQRHGQRGQARERAANGPAPAPPGNDDEQAVQQGSDDVPAAAATRPVEQRDRGEGSPDVRPSVSCGLHRWKRRRQWWWRRLQKQIAQLVQVDRQEDPATAIGHRRSGQEQPSARVAQPPGESQDHGGAKDRWPGKDNHVCS